MVVSFLGEDVSSVVLAVLFRESSSFSGILFREGPDFLPTGDVGIADIDGPSVLTQISIKMLTG